MLMIGSGDARCTIYPNLGGSIGSWTIAKQPMLRTAGALAITNGDRLGMASLPLVPYSNRIGNGTFNWHGQSIELTKNFAPEPHSIHGVGWQRPWIVTEQTEKTVTLQHRHRSDASWPWPFEAEQQITITDHQLTLNLRVQNNATTPVPLAFGHHPYFDAVGATLQFAADAVWMACSNGLPTEARSPDFLFDFHNGAPVEGRDIDHCYAGVTGPARITWVHQPWALEIASAPQLEAAVVYIPAGGDAFCFEPVPHINNALNLPGHIPAMPIVEAGETFETRITFRALPK
jgi:aldose 1-epimerase